MPGVPAGLQAVGATVGGRVLAGATGVLAAVRPAAKPLHPRGELLQATIRRAGLSRRTGVAWLDEPGKDEVLVRLSRAVGLPSYLPDIHGLALRIPGTEGPADLLLASTGLGSLSRFVLTGSRSPQGRPMTTLLPYRTPRGPLLIAARHRSPSRMDLLVASPGGRWSRFGELALSAQAIEGDEADVDFDPVRHTLPGLGNYPWVERLREPSYITARRSRGATAP